MADHSGMTLADRYRRAVAGRLREQRPAEVRVAFQQMAAPMEQFGRGLHAHMTLVTGWLRAVVQNLHDANQDLIEALAPGTFFGDLLRVRGYEGQSEAERALAASRLVRNWFARRHVFHTKQWEAGVGEAFDRRVRDRNDNVDGTPRTRRHLEDAVWEDLATAPLFEASLTLPRTSGLTVRDLYCHVRRRIRLTVEKDLIWHKRIIVIGDARAIQEEQPLPDDLLALAELRVDLERASAYVKNEDTLRLLILHEVLGLNLDTLARPLGISPEALAMRLYRARTNMQKSLKILI